MGIKSKSLRQKFIRQIIFAFLIILIVIFFVFAALMHGFFSSTVEELDVIENRLIAEDTNVQISKYINTTESLSKNANLVDMLIQCKTPQEFNDDHNFPLVAESLERAQVSLPKSEQIWVFNLENLYEIRSGDEATQIPLTQNNIYQLDALRKHLRSSAIIEFVDEQNQSAFNIITPITRDGVVYGLAGTNLEIDGLIREVSEKAVINNMLTACSLIAPTFDKNFNIIGYHEFTLVDDQVKRRDIPTEFMSGYGDYAEEKDQTSGKTGKKFIAGIGDTGWYISCFVPNGAVAKVFIESYSLYGMGFYIFVVLVVMLVVWLVAFRITQPIHDLGALVSNIRNHRPYEKLKGDNEITQAADSLIAHISENEMLLDEIGNLAKGIGRGELDRRLEKDNMAGSDIGIKNSLNQMLDSISHVLNYLPVGIAIIDEDNKILYLNETLHQTLGISSKKVEEGLSVSQLVQLDERSREKIIEEIQECQRNAMGREAKFFAMGKHIVFATVKLDYAQGVGEKDVFLQVYSNQTDLIEKISEQEQVFAYFMHISLAKKEALDRLAKGDFQHASMEIGQRPSAPYLQTIYDDQLEAKRAFGDTVNNIEKIIKQLSDATQAFANGNLHAFIDADDARGSYADIVQTANHAFGTILDYFQALPNPVRIIGKDYKVKFFNKASYASGFRPGKEVFCYHAYKHEAPCKDCPYLTGVDTLAIRAYACQEGESTKYWKIYRNPLKDQNGQIISILEIRIDETEIIKLQKEADSANMAKSTFIANMSHEIRTPMNAIIGYSQLLELSGRLDKSSRDYVEIIRRSGHHLLSLINDILEISKIEAGKITLVEEAFDLHDLLEDVKSMFIPQMQAKNLEFEVSSAKNLESSVIGDIGKVRQIILNVVSNAVKFTKEGQIRIIAETELVDNDTVRVRADISDTGSGISEKDWEQVFAAFEQTAAGNASGTGTGLGMAISRNFARMMGGDLTILTSQVGKGTTFRIELILQKGVSGQGKYNSDVSCDAIRAVDGDYTVLIADKAEDGRDILQKILEQVGFHVLLTCNGKTAFDLWESNNPDLVITDLSLNGTDGLSLIQMIRNKESDTHTPILVLTTRALDQNKEEALEAGADLFMTKPFIIGKLMQEIGVISNIKYQCEDQSKELDTQDAVAKEEVPPDAIEDIREALMRGDFDTVIRIANSLVLDCPMFASLLERYADSFDKEAILNLLDN